MSDAESPKKPPPGVPPPPPPLKAFPPVPRPSASADPAVEVPPVEPGIGMPQSLEAEFVEPRSEPEAQPAPTAPTPAPITDAAPTRSRVHLTDHDAVDGEPTSGEVPSTPVSEDEKGTEEEEPPSFEGLVIAARATQVSEPFALEALGSAARLIANPISTAEAADIIDVRGDVASAPDSAQAVPRQDGEELSALADEAPATTPSIPGPPPSAPKAEVFRSVAPAPDDVAVTTRLVATLLMAASLVMVVWHMQLSSRENANTGSRYATIESLVDYGTYNIDASRYIFTPDKVKARGHFVSSKPPLLPTYGAGVYWLLKRVTGYNITENESIVVWTVGVFTGWLGHLVFLVYFYRLCRLLLVRQLALLVTMAAACFAYLGVAYGTAINNHNVGAALAVAGFYHAFRARNKLGGAFDWVFAGLFLGILPAIDLSSLALTGVTFIYLATKDWRRALLLYVPVAAPGIVAQVLLAHSATGSWIPAYADTGLMTYKGSYFGGRRAGIDALFEPKSTYAFNVLIGHHGVFSMTPIYVFSLYEIVRRLIKREKYVAETIVFSLCFTVVTAFYIFRTHNYGGWCVGMRWLVPVMPWLLVMFGLWLDRATLNRLKWSLVVVAFSISAFNVQDGLTSPFQFSVWHNWLEDQPNRNRIGTTWVLSRPNPLDHKKPPRGRPRPKPAPAQ